MCIYCTFPCFGDKQLWVCRSHYLSVAAPPHRLQLGPCRQNTAASPPPAAPCRYELHTTAAAPDTLCDLMEKQHQNLAHWQITALHSYMFAHTQPFLAASWMGDASRWGVWMEALCCKMSLTQAALPLLQELKRGVAPSVDTASTYGGDNDKDDDTTPKTHYLTCYYIIMIYSFIYQGQHTDKHIRHVDRYTT